MSLFKIAWRSIQQRGLASMLTMLSMALGVALVSMVIVAHGVISDYFRRAPQGYHLIAGAKGGSLQLVLNTVYHLDQPVENIPWTFYKEFTEGEFAPYVEAAIPYCLGDSYESPDKQFFRVVGTTPDLFDKIAYGQLRDGSRLIYEFREGRNFKKQNYFEAVVGSVVAKAAGLKVGDKVNPTHGLPQEGADSHQHDPFTVVGILEPTGTPNDRAVFVNMEGFLLLEGHAKEGHHHGDDEKRSAVSGQRSAEEKGSKTDPHDHDDHAHDDHAHDDHAHDDHGHDDHGHDDHGHDDHDHADHDHDHDHAHDDHAHDHDHHAHDHGHDHDHDHHHHEPLPEDQREVTAVLVLLKPEQGDLISQHIIRTINKGNVAQAVAPSAQIFKFLESVVGPMQIILLALTILIVIVAGISILVSIYNSMNERRHELAVMRALGAGRGTLLSIILLESILISLVGGALGLVLGHGALGGLSPAIAARTGVSVGFLQFSPQELILIPGLIALAALVGLLPALDAYRTDVAKSLSANP